MQIELKNLGKRFNRQWIFRKLDATIPSGQAYAITGHNGSGKSTLLQILGGAMEKSTGEILYTLAGKPIPPEKLYAYCSLAAPYLELVEELTLTEFFRFHFGLKPMLPSWTIDKIMDRIELYGARNKQIRYFSSGMKQRAKLGQAMFSNTPLVMLDEPTANLDVQGIALYHSLVEELGTGRTLLVCSNDEQEIRFCSHRILITDYKD